MAAAKFIIIGLQIVLALILIVVVLLQSGSQRGLSGSIAGGAETFFGKNKGRTIDAKLKKWTSIVAVLFLLSSIGLNIILQVESNKATEKSVDAIEQAVEEGAVQAENEDAHVHEEGEEAAPVEGEDGHVHTEDEHVFVEETPAEGEEAPAESEETPAESAEAAE